jgi:CubicO group peptidase (beta-lactamase class C family)
MAVDTIRRIGSMTKPIVAACAMTLVEDCTLRLDDPVDGLLPELADMTVLADPSGPLEDTVPAARPITLRDLRIFTLGTGIVVAEPGTIPIADALNALQSEPAPPPDVWIHRLGALPLVYQPGERWMYHTAANVTGVLIARATGEDGGGGLVSTASDYLAFASALLAGGTSTTSAGVSGCRSAPGARTSDPGRSRTRRRASVGSYGWPGIYGTGWYNDPAEDMSTILMIQRAPAPPGLPILLAFWTAAYQAIDD